jgi:hypothetical protein
VRDLITALLPRKADAWCNEDGKVLGLPINKPATMT